MSEVMIPKYMTDLCELTDTAPSVFDALVKTMSIQPELDPDAGYGVFQIVTLFLNLNLEPLRAQRLVERLGYNEIKLYVFIRSHYMGGFPINELNDFIDGKIDFDLVKLYRDLRVFVPSFSQYGIVKHLS